MDPNTKAYADTLYERSQHDSAHTLREDRAELSRKLAALDSSASLPLSGTETQRHLSLFMRHIERCMAARFDAYRKAFAEIGKSPTDHEIREILEDINDTQAREVAHSAQAVGLHAKQRGGYLRPGGEYDATEHLKHGSAHGHDRVLQDLKVWQGEIHLANAVHPAGDNRPTTGKGVPVLISHSSKDAALAASLIDLLRSALGLSVDQIRCTSVDGYRLPAGVNTADQLRDELISARVLIGLLTPNSVSSTYVLFELGARWGTQLPMIPLLAGVKPEDMRGPHSALNALSCETEGQLLQLVDDTGRELRITPQSPASYLRHANAVKALAESIRPPTPHATQAERKQPSETANRDLTLSIRAEGTPPSQVLKLVANQPIAVSRLEYMLSEQTCIVAEDVSLAGVTVEVPLNHESLTKLFNIPRHDRDTSDGSGPVKFGLTVTASGKSHQYILPARMENNTYGNTCYRNVIGSAQFHGIG